jgi:hypothetical protein
VSATVAGMQTSTTYATPGGVDPSELDRHIAEMHHDISCPILGGGVRVAQAARGEGFTHTTKTEEVSK